NPVTKKTDLRTVHCPILAELKLQKLLYNAAKKSHLPLRTFYKRPFTSVCLMIMVDEVLGGEWLADEGWVLLQEFSEVDASDSMSLVAGLEGFYPFEGLKPTPDWQFYCSRGQAGVPYSSLR
ncbi:unnamed protein product, partial [Ilex paraguariensis]